MVYVYTAKGFPIELSNTLITSHIYLFCVRIFKFHSLRKFQFYHTVLSAISTILYIRSSELIHLTAESLCPFTNLSQFLVLPAPGNYLSTHCFYKFISFLKITHVSDTMKYLSFSVWFISLCTMLSSFVHVFARRDFLLFKGWIIFHCINI